MHYERSQTNPQSTKENHLPDTVKLELRIKQTLQQPNVEQVPTNCVMLRDGIPELDPIVVHRGVDPLVIEEVREVVVQEIHKPIQFEVLSLALALLS